MNTKKHNQRKRKRGYKNLFWLVKSTLIGSKQLLLYNRKPYKIDISYYEYGHEYYDKLKWFSCYDETYLKNDAINKFPITHNDIIPVKIVLDLDNNNPDLLIYRKRDNLFISDGIVKYKKGKEEVIELRCPSRISPKLFPEITEKDGIVGVKIEKYNKN